MALTLPNEKIWIRNSITVFTGMYERFPMSFLNFDIYSNLPYYSPYITLYSSNLKYIKCCNSSKWRDMCLKP